MYFLVLLQQLLASFTHIIAKDLTSYIEPTVVLLFRSLIAGLVFGVYLIWFHKKLKRIEKRDILLIVVLSILNIPINQFLFVTSIKLTTAPNVSLAYALTPIFVLLISLPILEEKPNLLKVGGIVVAIIGTIMIITQNGIDFFSDGFLGDVLALLASVSWAFYTVLGKKVILKYGAIHTTALTMTIGMLFYVPIFLLMGSDLSLAKIGLSDWLGIIYLGVFTSVIAYIIWYYALTRLEATKLSIFNNLQPVFTTIFSVILFNYFPTTTFVLGGILVILGVVITQKG